MTGGAIRGPLQSANVADIVVIGGGGAGLAAAAEAARLGRRVILLEKNLALGGTTAMAVGSIMGAGTEMQRRAGIEDSPSRHERELAQYVQRLGISDNPELRSLLAEHAGETVDFLSSIGVDFVGPLAQPPFETNRFYQALPGARAYVHHLGRYCRRIGVNIRLGARVERLLMRAERVVGVEMETSHGTRERLEANAAVILASGDFAANRAMRTELLGNGIHAIEPVNATATGDGQRMAVAIGAKLVLRPDLKAKEMVRCRFAAPSGRDLIASLPPLRGITLAMKLALKILPYELLRPLVLRAAITSLAPERALFEHGAILVNRNGERFTDELSSPGAEIAKQPGGDAFIIFDQRIAELFNSWPNFVSTAPGLAFAYIDDYRAARKDIFCEAASVEALAERLEIPPSRLKDTVASRNTAQVGTARSLVMAPYLALGPLKPWIVVTPVGLAVNTRVQVLNKSGAAITGLFAAGGVGQGGFSIVGHGHGLGWALTSGRLAGRYAATEM